MGALDEANRVEIREFCSTSVCRKADQTKRTDSFNIPVLVPEGKVKARDSSALLARKIDAQHECLVTTNIVSRRRYRDSSFGKIGRMCG